MTEEFKKKIGAESLYSMLLKEAEKITVFGFDITSLDKEDLLVAIAFETRVPGLFQRKLVKIGDFPFHKTSPSLTICEGTISNKGEEEI